MAFYLALAVAAGYALAKVLHVLGQKYPAAEKAAEALDEVEKVVDPSGSGK